VGAQPLAMGADQHRAHTPEQPIPTRLDGRGL
jgi:hypothetical protein